MHDIYVFCRYLAKLSCDAHLFKHHYISKKSLVNKQLDTFFKVQDELMIGEMQYYRATGKLWLVFASAAACIVPNPVSCLSDNVRQNGMS